MPWLKSYKKSLLCIPGIAHFSVIMSKEFRDLLRKVGSGPHTSKNLTREESARAMELMLTKEATPAQIGAFLIAHRIKRPTGTELAGMLDAFDQWGPKVPTLNSGKSVLMLSQPYDGRDRTCPLSPLTALLLAAAGCPVLQHGGDRMPTKEGIPLMEIWQGLGVNWRSPSLGEIQAILEKTNLAFVYLAKHFPQAEALVSYRREIGKRPPIATLELIWSPYAGKHHVVAGFVHPPTENMITEALTLRGVSAFTTVKGLEGSCDLPQERTAIIGLYDLTQGDNALTRLRLHAADFGLGGKNPVWTNLTDYSTLAKATLAGEQTPLRPALIWNSAFYLWQHTDLENLETAIAKAEQLIDDGLVQQQWHRLQSYAK
ncbi:Anthranilate phosphoribosyltransferase [Synechocystis sp. PCC 6714]|nr:Anthranilate phosphoribosyltransferase [Synechocystis sp. PCC 6714]